MTTTPTTTSITTTTTATTTSTHGAGVEVLRCVWVRAAGAGLPESCEVVRCRCNLPGAQVIEIILTIAVEITAQALDSPAVTWR